MALTQKIEFEFSEQSLAAMRELSNALNEHVPDHRLMAMLRDVWVQFGIQRQDASGALVGIYSGGLSVLEDIEHELRAARMIDHDGLETVTNEDA